MRFWEAKSACLGFRRCAPWAPRLLSSSSKASKAWAWSSKGESAPGWAATVPGAGRYALVVATIPALSPLAGGLRATLKITPCRQECADEGRCPRRSGQHLTARGAPAGRRGHLGDISPEHAAVVSGTAKACILTRADSAPLPVRSVPEKRQQGHGPVVRGTCRCSGPRGHPGRTRRICFMDWPPALRAYGSTVCCHSA